MKEIPKESEKCDLNYIMKFMSRVWVWLRYRLSKCYYFEIWTYVTNDIYKIKSQVINGFEGTITAIKLVNKLTKCHGMQFLSFCPWFLGDNVVYWIINKLIYHREIGCSLPLFWCCSVRWPGWGYFSQSAVGLVFCLAQRLQKLSYRISSIPEVVVSAGLVKEIFLLYAVFLKSLATSLEYFTMFLKRDLVEHF